MPVASSVDPGAGLWRRITAFWPAKLCLTAILGVCFWVCYLFLSWHALVRIHSLPITPLDSWAGFQPTPWAWVYESNFFLTGFIPWLIISRIELRRYVIGFALLSILSFLIFALFPVAAPRPVNLEENTALIFITHVDGPLNAFPSLHAASLVYTIALARRLFGRQLKLSVLAGLLIWASLILFATLATKQHYAVDLVAGGLIGWLADWFAWHKADPEAMASAKT